jgi:CRISPR-associated endonuclease/helicase Cas3
MPLNESNLPSYFNYWGKADPTYQGEPKWHPLAYHCLDVAAAAAAWWDQSTAIPHAFASAFSVDKKHTSQLRAWVLFFTALHDIGKLDVRFQLKSKETLPKCWPELNLDDVDTASHITESFNHGSAGYAWASKEYPQWLSNDDGDYQIWDAWRPWLSAVTGHHGDLSDNSGLYPPDGEEYVADHDQKARATWVKTIDGLFLRPKSLFISDLPPTCGETAKMLMAGFCSISDWIGSHQDYFHYAEPVTKCTSYFANRVRSVKRRKLLFRLGLIRRPSQYGGIATLLETDARPRGMQVLVDSLPLSPGLTIVEAPTGSGKTEAALAYAWRLLETGHADSIVFALPTQATANAMLKRLEAFADKAFDGQGTNVVLAHGKRNFNREFQRLIEAYAGHTPQGRDEGSSQCSTWLAQSRKRVFLGQVSVCTIDQVLLSVLPVKHKFVRGFGISKSVLIVDEVHAYDSYMHGLLSKVLYRQKESGGSTVLLSATLPLSVRTSLLEAWCSPEALFNDYPLVTYVSRGEPLPMILPDEHRPEQYPVSIECIPSPNAFPDEALLQRVALAAKEGARVAFVCNLVNDAQQIAISLRTMLDDTLIPVDVFHARYRFLDRQIKEESAITFYGKNAPRDGGRVLVATQVIEQSLDLDFDLLFTQICPVDLLFQRLGRLHRHPQKRPLGFESPHCIVVTAQDWKYGLHKEIYGNTRVLWRTETCLRNTKGNVKEILFPEAYREWIDAVYMRDDWEEEPSEIACEYDVFSALQHHRKSEAERLTSMSMTQFRDEDDRITSLTRDSEMSLTVVPVQRGGKFLDGTSAKGLDEGVALELLSLNSIPVPAGWDKYLHGCDRDEDGRYFLEMDFDTFRWVCRKGKCEFSYTTDFGLERRKE